MPDDFLILKFIAAIFTAALLLYGSYWAFAIASARPSKLYRRQALSVGVIGMYFGLLWILSSFTNPLTPGMTLTFAISAIAFFAGIILMFGWIDSSVRLARRSDPLRRDTFHWRKVRIIFWSAIVIDVIAIFVIFSRLSDTAQSIPGIQNIGFLGSILAIVVIGSPALFVAGRRSRDPTLHRNLKWFALFIILILFYAEFGYLAFALGVSSGSGSTYTMILNAVSTLVAYLTVVGGYALFRSARSLAPIRPFPKAQEISNE